MNDMERTIVAKAKHAIATGDPMRLRPSELRHLKDAIPEPPPTHDVIHNLYGPSMAAFGGIAIVVENPPGYPTSVTPRPRKKGRRR